jgi:hypothetical protein
MKIKPFLIKLHWLISTQFGLDPRVIPPLETRALEEKFFPMEDVLYEKVKIH